MDALVSIVGSLAAKAAEYTVDPTAQQLSYFFKHKSKFLNLRIKVQDLKDARERVQQSVDAANRNGEVIFDHVERWLTVVNEKISEDAATRLQEDEEKAMKSCFAGICVDFKSRYQLSKQAEKEADAIAQLLNENNRFDSVSYHPDIAKIGSIRPVKEYEIFGSRSGAFGGVMEAFEEDNVNIIGVHGMGGVGKTTLVKEAARQAKEKQLFDEVVLVAITQTPNMVNIQNEIAEKIGLTIAEKSIDVRAARLRERLKKEKKILIILDDIWVTLDLEALGIPSRDEHKGCKILMTSRRLDVLESMNSHPNISIETLKEDEAWNLFTKLAGPIVERFDLQYTAVEVAKRCAGLPVAIATLAKALKRKHNLYEWENALEQLKPSKINFRGISGAVYSAIEMSYKYLETEELKFTFLLCSIMGHNAAIQDLLKHCRGFGLFHGLDTMEKVRNRVLALVGELKDSSLLLAGPTPERFDMHDVVCDVAISIASRDHCWLALRDEDVFEEWSSEDQMRNYNLVSLTYAKVSVLPDELECPKLTFFSMYGTVDVPNNFFKGMHRLKVLVFSEMRFTSLPSSIGSLKTLCTLCLIDCDLDDIVILGEMENLEILDLRGSSIAVLPKEIGQLSRLKLLDLSHCYNLKVISPNVLSNLSRLEELYLYDSFDRWEVEVIENPRTNASLVELNHLSLLTTLEVHIPDVQAIPTDNLFSGKMERYKISIGDQWYPYNRGMETSRLLKIEMDRSIHLVDGIKLLLRKVESLYLKGVNGVTDMLYDPITEGLPNLKHLDVSNVSDIEVAVNSMMLVSCLESLSLYNLMNLVAICDYQLRDESFCRLKVIKVDSCNMLKNLFSSSVAKGLCQLEEIKVSNCENMTELIVEKEESGENEILEFSQLRILWLEELNRFNGLWYSERTFQFATWLFDRKILCPALKELDLDSVSGIGKIWNDDRLTIMSFGAQCLTSLSVNGCHKLKYVFTSSMVKSFVQLKRLVVSHCDQMEEVIEGMLAEERTGSSIRVFPKLDSLKLDALPRLKGFCSGTDLIEFPLLRHLIIQSCPDLKTFVFDNRNRRAKISLDHNYLFNEKVILPLLEKLEFYKMDNLERLWPDRLAEHSFSELTSVRLSFCPKLSNVFPSSILAGLQRLGRLSIRNCESLEEIISESQSPENGSGSAMSSLPPQLVQSDVTTFEFPYLTFLCLSDLPNLRSIHHKMHTATWPSLKKMVVKKCDKVEILFACQETSGNTSQQPLFWVNQFTFPNLHQLTLGWNAGIKEIWRFEGQQQKQLSQYFCNLKAVKLENYPEQLTVLPSYLFELLSLSNLQTLEISWSRFKEILFQSEGGVGLGGKEKPAWMLVSPITKLKLYFLFELFHLWEEGEGFPNLRILHVQSCSQLKRNLVPSCVSFRNLVTLKVLFCHGIIRLITHSTTKSLVQLKEMSIRNCRRMEEILEDGDDDDHHNEISFPQLNRLELEDLPKLQSFCSSQNYTFEFPSLEILLLDNCPRMEMFSRGDSKTPMLHKVRLDEWGTEEHWEGSLNSTIQQLFKRKCTKAEN